MKLVNLSRFRKNKQLTQIDLANELNLTRNNISDWEIGRTEPSLETLIKISNYFNVTIDELLGLPIRAAQNELNKTISLLPEQQELIQKIKEIRDPMTLAMINGYTDAITAQIKQNKKDAI